MFQYVCFFNLFSFIFPLFIPLWGPPITDFLVENQQERWAGLPILDSQETLSSPALPLIQKPDLRSMLELSNRVVNLLAAV